MCATSVVVPPVDDEAGGDDDVGSDADDYYATPNEYASLATQLATVYERLESLRALLRRGEFIYAPDPQLTIFFQGGDALQLYEMLGGPSESDREIFALQRKRSLGRDVTRDIEDGESRERIRLCDGAE